MTQVAECSECGNARALFGSCPHCGSSASPILAVDVVELNIKHGNPSVEDALNILAVKIRELQELGIKAIILIHGYGSSGEGGHIKRAIHEALELNYYADRIDEYFYGENVPYGSPAYHELMKKRPSLKRYLRHFKASNAGITVLLLGSGYRNA
ncbi:DNA mismatch repair protein MutS [Polynucleobacter tropicus]|uniref:DNA mismatch repair protein MutS n=1 Tax=Polynucleobacter tropicus TaxID=1743174 RepID=A0A6M9Q144_9BURK|nr:DNA mismatch repair protein MutS [Polynucleobacter tropicus]QKM64765.1 DNA mismatch repair protein MutS [Polynucleobacter tropicus]